jgi:hypothetical protein
MQTPAVTMSGGPATDAERTTALEDMGKKTAEAFGKWFLDMLKASREGQQLLAANERAWKAVAKAFEDFADTIAGKLVISAAAAGATAGLGFAAWSTRDPMAMKSLMTGYADTKFFGISLVWDGTSSPTGIVIVTPWINSPVIPIGPSAPDKPTSFRAPPVGVPPPQVQGPDPGKGVSDSVIHAAVMQNLMKVEGNVSKQLEGVIAKQQGVQPGASHQMGPVGEYRPPSLSFLPPLSLSAQPPAQKKSSQPPAAERARTGLGLPGPGGGVELPVNLRGSMEAAFGHDFASVRIHEGQHAQSINARAYTRGSDVHFAPGQWRPGTQEGRELIGHELAHVVQQSQGRVQATAQASGIAINDDAALEREADEAGSNAARGERVQ